ncbi:8-amino-7-oxononanoate synthase [Methylocucumis oryzae]|uniref:8-amino-7-oxononanoate synthase n=1 Tax=Methylocucumis oryzae TaxID=1632867 RepID=UPI0009E4762A
MLETAQGVKVKVDGRNVINFCSNDYLGLASHPKVIQALQQGAEQYGVGSGSAHLIAGHSQAHHELELALAEFTGRERALLFSTGYMANIGVMTALLNAGDTVLEDRLNHASLLDGGLSSGARFQRYAHANSQHLAEQLAKAKAKGNKLIVTDGVFSMDGDMAPLAELATLAREHKAWIMVDDAHGLGVLGAQGGGVLEQLQLTQDDVPILMATLGKALGCCGAFVAGSEALIETLIQSARTFIYTTALPPALACASLTSLTLLRDEAWRRDKLAELSVYFSEGAKRLGLEILPSVSAIHPVIIGDSGKALAVSQALLVDGLWVTAIRPPTVPKGSARLRVTLSAEHDKADIDYLLTRLAHHCH